MDATWFNVPNNLKDRIVSYGVKDSIGFHEYPRIPEKPVKSPFAPITLWQGTTMGSGFAPLAAPTARQALGLFSLVAIEP